MCHAVSPSDMAWFPPSHRLPAVTRPASDVSAESNCCDMDRCVENIDHLVDVRLGRMWRLRRVHDVISQRRRRRSTRRRRRLSRHVRTRRPMLGRAQRPEALRRSVSMPEQGAPGGRRHTKPERLHLPARKLPLRRRLRHGQTLHSHAIIILVHTISGSPPEKLGRSAEPEGVSWEDSAGVLR